MTRAKPKPSISRSRAASASAPRLAGASAKAAAAVVRKPATKLEALPRPARAAKSGATRAPVASSTKLVVKPKLAALTAKAGRPAPLPAAVAVPSKAKAAGRAAARGAVAAKPVLVDTPAKIRPIEQAVGVSSDAVARRTGKSWAEWFALLDAAGAAELDHKGIVAVLAQRHGVGPWWQQMVTVAYEQARGKREKQDTDDGYQVDVSKTLELPLAKLFRFWAEPAERNKWLADDRFSIHKATASKSIRARWGRGVSRIDVDFLDKGAGKSQVTVQHNRIESPDAAEQMKAYWAKKIRALEALLTRP
ncbi:MAG TPA: hypothetical protein VNW92_24700 [Polyangiaceae bacterium]|jgi:hypothetical protein|nr:hypothetical protein [Polyangiaceae bacterium]